MSPAIQNRLFRNKNINAVYIPIQTDNLSDAVAFVRSTQNFMGANITIPYKKSVISFLDAVSEEAELCGAVNTIYKKNGSLCGANSDIAGFSDALKYDLKFDAKDADVALLGSGGAARAVVAAIGNLANSITIVARNRNKIEALIEQFSGKLKARFYIKNWGEQFAADLIINATPIGLNGELLPIDFGKSAFFDLVYSKDDTPSVKLCKKQGNRAIDGKYMLKRQAEISFKIWMQEY